MDIIQTHHGAELLIKHAQPGYSFVFWQIPRPQDCHWETVVKGCCRNAMCKSGDVGSIGTEATGSQDVDATLFPQLVLVKVSWGVDVYVRRSVTSEKVTPPVAPHSHYHRWKFPLVDVTEGSFFPLIFCRLTMQLHHAMGFHMGNLKNRSGLHLWDMFPCLDLFLYIVNALAMSAGVCT